MHNISIVPVLNGYLCNVGCQSIVFSNPDHLLHELRRYLIDPEAVEGEYRNTSLNRRLLKRNMPEQDRIVNTSTPCTAAPHSLAGADTTERAF